MNLTFDRRYDKWQDARETQERCETCMYDAPYDYCCKHHCGDFDRCTDCTAKCRYETFKLCEK